MKFQLKKIPIKFVFSEVIAVAQESNKAQIFTRQLKLSMLNYKMESTIIDNHLLQRKAVSIQRERNLAKDY